MATGRRWGEGGAKKREAKECRQLWTGRGRVAFTRPRRRLSGSFCLMGTGDRQRRGQQRDMLKIY